VIIAGAALTQQSYSQHFCADYVRQQFSSGGKMARLISMIFGRRDRL